MPDGPIVPPVQHKSRRRRFIGLAALVCYATFWAFGGCADMFLLHPTNGRIATEGATEAQIPVPSATPVQVFQRTLNVATGDEPKAFILVFDGNGGRAENAVFWGDDIARVGEALE